MQIPLIEIRITGDNIQPGTVRSKDLAEILTSVEDMIASLVEYQNPRIEKEEIIVGLVDVQGGSLRLHFASPIPDLVLPAYFEIASSIEARDFNSLPKDSIRSLGKIASFARKRNTNLELKTLNGKETTLAIVTPSLLVDDIPFIAGYTTIYGELIRIGGRKPRLTLELGNRRGINCEFSGKTEEQRRFIQQLAPRIYTWVGLYGEAKWSSKDFSLREFNIHRVTEYEDIPFAQAISQLSQLAGKYFDDIDDVDDFVATVRDKATGS